MEKREESIKENKEKLLLAEEKKHEKKAEHTKTRGLCALVWLCVILKLSAELTSQLFLSRPLPLSRYISSS